MPCAGYRGQLIFFFMLCLMLVPVRQPGKQFPPLQAQCVSLSVILFFFFSSSSSSFLLLFFFFFFFFCSSFLLFFFFFFFSSSSSSSSSSCSSSVLVLTSPVPHARYLQISVNRLKPPQLWFSYMLSSL